MKSAEHPLVAVNFTLRTKIFTIRYGGTVGFKISSSKLKFVLEFCLKIEFLPPNWEIKSDLESDPKFHEKSDPAPREKKVRIHNTEKKESFSRTFLRLYLDFRFQFYGCLKIKVCSALPAIKFLWLRNSPVIFLIQWLEAFFNQWGQFADLSFQVPRKMAAFRYGIRYICIFPDTCRNLSMKFICRTIVFYDF